VEQGAGVVPVAPSMLLVRFNRSIWNADVRRY